MAQIPRFLNSVVVFDADVAPGKGEQASSILPALVTQKRPNNLFRYVYAVMISCTFTPTYGGGQAAALVAKKMWQLVSKFYLKIKGIDTPLFRDLGSLDIIRIAQQGLRAIDPDVLSEYIPVTDLAAAQTGVEQEVHYLFPIAPRYTKGGENEAQKFLGLLPLSAFAEADMKFTPVADDELQADWTIGDIGFRVRLLLTDQNKAIPIIPCFWRGSDLTGSDVIAPKGTNDARVLFLAACATDDTDFVPPTDYSCNIGSKVVLPNRHAADQIQELTLFRKETYNDSPFPVMQPILTDDGAGVDELPIADGPVTLNGIFSGQANSGRIIMLYAEQLSEAAQIQLQVAHDIDKDVATANVQRITAETNSDNRALVTTTIARAS